VVGLDAGRGRREPEAAGAVRVAGGEVLGDDASKPTP
jgi:hypothetical protein